MEIEDQGGQPQKVGRVGEGKEEQENVIDFKHLPFELYDCTVDIYYFELTYLNWCFHLLT